MTTEAATKLAPFGVEHVKSVCRDILFPDNMTPDETADLRWGFRLNSLDFTSHGEFRWPFPGHWAEASGPFTQLPSACPSAEGDGICIAKTISGAQSGSGRFGKSTGLLVAYLPADLLAEETDKLRVKRAWVADVFDPVRALTLSGADLSGADLSGADLSGANLSGANLSRADLSGADLSGANLSGADLSRANLSGADLSGANLSGANLSGADLSGANLSRANLSRANLSGAYLSGADLSGANLSGANLSGANLSGANLSGADLSRANLSGADLSGANLSRADLSGANLSGADLSGANLSRANLSGPTSPGPATTNSRSGPRALTLPSPRRFMGEPVTEVAS